MRNTPPRNRNIPNKTKKGKIFLWHQSSNKYMVFWNKQLRGNNFNYIICTYLLLGYLNFLYQNLQSFISFVIKKFIRE